MFLPGVLMFNFTNSTFQIGNDTISSIGNTQTITTGESWAQCALWLLLIYSGISAVVLLAMYGQGVMDGRLNVRLRSWSAVWLRCLALVATESEC